MTKAELVARLQALEASVERERAARRTAEKKLTAALAQQTATAEILHLISQAPADLSEVGAAILRNATRLCEAQLGNLFVHDGGAFHAVAHHNASQPFRDVLSGPLRPGAETGIERLLVDPSPFQIADVRATDAYRESEPYAVVGADLEGIRTLLAVPLARDGRLVGMFTIYRREIRPFAPKQIELVKAFADQAVIAIENARLFGELDTKNRALTTAYADVTAALDRQTATADILRVISRSGTDVQPVFDAIAESSRRLLRGWSTVIWRLDGERLHVVSACGGLPGSDEAPGTFVADTLRDGEPRQVVDAEAPDAHPLVRESARVGGWRSNLAVPMLQSGRAVGVIAVSRAQPGGFTPPEVELLKTFADQAVIALENTRLLMELQSRTQELSRSVEQLTALGEVGRAVSSTLDLDTVLTTIVSRAVQLSGLDGGVIFEYDAAAEEFVQRAATERAALRLPGPARVRKGEGVVGRTAVTLEPVQVPDIAAPGAYDSRLRDGLIVSGVRALLAVPIMREGTLIGSLVVNRNGAGAFAPETIDLLRTFASQSALAIQNARLFHEIERKSRQLEVANRHKDEFLANMSHELRTPLNGIIGFSEVMLERMFGDLSDKQEEYLADILESGRHLLSLINDILDLSKIEAGKMELEITEFHLPTAIDNAMMLMRERAARKGQVLERAIDPSVGTVRGDERKVKQVMLNLLSNAVKFTPDGGRITVGAGLANGETTITVTDTGVGIAPEDHALVFEEFRQVGQADKKAEGTGLGLALCRKFVELHGGRISVTSDPGKGATFKFTLPETPPPGT